MKYRLMQLAFMVKMLSSKKDLTTGDRAELLSTCLRAMKACDISQQDIISVTEIIYNSETA